MTQNDGSEAHVLVDDLESVQRGAEQDLLDRARRFDSDAVDTLYSTHLQAARQVAVALAGPAAADDLVADAFARVLAQLHAGRGPASNFRSYLHQTIRNRHRDIWRRSHRESPVSHEPWVLEGGLEAEHGPEEELEQAESDELLVKAFDGLPQDWREVLWHLEVRNRPVHDVAALMNLTPAGVSSLAYRAREGLRLAYLDQMVHTTPPGRDCQWTRDRLSKYVRGRLSASAEGRLELHLRDCASCSATIADLAHTNRKLAALLGPVALFASTVPGGAPGGALVSSLTPVTSAPSHLTGLGSVAAWKAGAAAILMTGVVATPIMTGPPAAAMTLDAPLTARTAPALTTSSAAPLMTDPLTTRSTTWNLVPVIELDSPSTGTQPDVDRPTPWAPPPPHTATGSCAPFTAKTETSQTSQPTPSQQSSQESGHLNLTQDISSLIADVAAAVVTVGAGLNGLASAPCQLLEHTTVGLDETIKIVQPALSLDLDLSADPALPTDIQRPEPHATDPRTGKPDGRDEPANPPVPVPPQLDRGPVPGIVDGLVRTGEEVVDRISGCHRTSHCPKPARR